MRPLFYKYNLRNYERKNLPLKGAGGGGSEVDFRILVVSDRGECQLPGTFYGMKNFCS